MKDYGGNVVVDVGNRKGKRDVNNPIKSPNWGGKRTKKSELTLRTKYIHPDADGARKLIISRAVEVKKEQELKGKT